MQKKIYRKLLAYGKLLLNIFSVNKVYLCSIVIAFFSCSLSAQKVTIHAYSHSELTIDTSSNVIVAYIKKNNPFLSYNDTFKLTAFKESPLCYYYTFTQAYNHMPIYGTQLKVCALKSGEMVSINGNIYNTTTWHISAQFSQQKKLPQVIASIYNISKVLTGNAIVYIPENGIPELGYIFYGIRADKSSILLISNDKDELLEASDQRTYFSSIDSTVSGKVFLPDPLTSAGIVYGGSYADNNDADNFELNNQRIAVTFKSTFSNDTFYLENATVQLKDFASPYGTPAYSLFPDFDFTRHENAFEDVNAFYHITNFAAYIKSTGYTMLQNFHLEVDAHGASGADQSFFVGADTSSIQYGEGGVDDAEDADVIIHEYGHGLSYNAAPESNSGFERRALDEGYADYFAVSYSRMYSDFNWQNIFSWDGHNEFWSGRNANTNKHYPEDVNVSDYYATSEIWSGALMDIFDAIGKKNTDEIIFESLYGSYINMTMPDAAQVLLTSASLLFGESYYSIIYSILFNRGLLNYNYTFTLLNTTAIQFKNSNGYTFNNEALVIILPEVEEANITAYDMSGKIVYHKIFTGEINSILASEINCSAAILVVETAHAHAAIKLIKY